MAVKGMGGIKTTAARLLPRSAPPVTPSQEARMPPPPSATYERMRMSPIDQPLMLMELLGRHTQDVARRILASAWWAGFTFNGITRCE